MEITPAPHQRPTWDEYFMDINRAVGTRGSCDRGRAGAVVVRNNQILVTGYAGSPKGLPHCDEVGHQMKTLTHEDGHQTQHCTRTAHAEQNVIVQAAKTGVSIEGGTLYCKMTPCAVCAKMIINAGIVRVVCEKKYHAGKETEENFEQVGIKLEFLNEETEQYANQ
jgi:dCMP deaminase